MKITVPIHQAGLPHEDSKSDRADPADPREEMWAEMFASVDVAPVATPFVFVNWDEEEDPRRLEIVATFIRVAEAHSANGKVESFRCPACGRLR